MLSRRSLALSLIVLALVMLPVCEIYAADVVVSGSRPRDTYYRGEELVVYVSILNNHSQGSVLEVSKINVTIWRVEKRHEMWRNIEKVYNTSRKLNEKIEPEQIFSIEVRVKLDFTPARYNLTIAVIASFTGGAEKTYYPVKNHLFWVKSAVSIPPLGWAAIADVVLVLIAIILYRKLR